MPERQVIHTGTSLDLDRVPNVVTGTTLPIAPAVRVGDMVYTSGLVGVDPQNGQLVDGFAAQAEACLQNMRLVLEAAGSSMHKVAKVNVFFADIRSDFEAFNSVYRRHLGSEFPARTAVQAPLAFDALRIEVEAIAIV